MSKLTSETLCTPAGLLPAEQLEYWRELAHELLAALRELHEADAEFDRRRAGYNPRYATREQIDAYKAAENRRAVAAQIIANAAIARAEGRRDE